MSLFDPALWIELPDGVGLHRRDLGPCPCGERRFDVLRRRREDGSVQIKVACPRCVKRAAGEVGVGLLDMDQGRFLEARRAAG